MKAAIYTQYGAPEVLRVADVSKPTPNADEILVRVKATAVNSGDWRLRRADPFAVRFFLGLFRPKIQILGTVFSGEVESVGEAVTQYKAGDQVFGHTDMRFGAYAEYKTISETASIALKPDALSHREAAVIPFGGVTASHFLKKANIRPGQKVLIVGASGAVGSAAVQLAKSRGARVTGVCSTANVELVRSLGADHVIDYTREDFTQNGETYDLVWDTVNTVPLARAMNALTPAGTLVISAAGLREMLQGAWYSMTGKRKVLAGVISHRAADIINLKELAEAGAYKPVLDRSYPLAQIAEAHAYVEKGHKKGNVAIDV